MAGEPGGRHLSEKDRVGSLKTVYYIPDFISTKEEEQLLQALRRSKSAWKEVSKPISWERLKGPACQFCSYKRSGKVLSLSVTVRGSFQMS